MKHIHFKEIDSTQQYLRSEFDSLIKQDSHVLISSDLQTNGLGRKNNHWIDSPGSLAFSCAIPTTEKLSLIPLWVSLTIKNFFVTQFNISLQLKWPNDIYYNNQKCGGIICHKIDEFIVVGIGLNLSSSPQALMDNLNSAGHLDIPSTSLASNFKKEIPLRIYQHILTSSFNAQDIPIFFKEHCLYVGEHVKISEDDTVIMGKFIGIGEWGEAIIKDETNHTTSKILNGSLRKKD